MALSAEARAKGREVAAANRAARQAAVVSQSSPVAVATPEVDDEPTSEGLLSELATLFKQASSQKSGRDKAVTDALELLGNLDPVKYPDIADNPVVNAFIERVQAQRVKSTDLPPGSIIGQGITAFKKPWSWGDLKVGMNVPLDEVERRNRAGEIIFPWVEYTPIKTTPIIWNGLIVYFKARQKVYCCKVFVDVFEESLNQEEFAEQHAAWLMGNPNIPGRRDFFTSNAPRVRAMNMSKGEYHQPGGGMISLAPSPDLVAMGGGGGASEET